MTVFDALVLGAPDSSRTGGHRGISTDAGDWRRAVEYAQAKAWLGDRNVATGIGARLEDGRAAFAERNVSAQKGFSQPIGWNAPLPPPKNEAGTGRSVGTSLTQQHVAPSPLPESQVIPASLPLQPVPARPEMACRVEPPGAVSRTVYALAVRPRKQSLHVETGEQGVSVWVRDAAMNSQQANHLAAAIVANIGNGEHHLAALYLNGRTLAEYASSHFPSLFSPNPSE